MSNALYKLALGLHGVAEGFAAFYFYFSPEKAFPPLAKADVTTTIFVHWWAFALVTHSVVSFLGFFLTTTLQKKLLAFAISLYHLGLVVDTIAVKKKTTEPLDHVLYLHSGLLALYVLVLLTVKGSSSKQQQNTKKTK